MCGRYALITDAAIAARYDRPILGGYAVSPRYNVAPTQNAPIVTPRGIEVMHWGLMPQWLKDPRGAVSMINARAEDLLDRPTYRPLVSRGRCLVPASGFYEWKQLGAIKQPYFFDVPGEPLISFAGLYTRRLDAEGLPILSFTIITTRANALVAPVHDRMPVILAPADEALWLDESITDVADVLPLLRPFPSSKMAVRAVGRAVAKPSSEGPELIEPIADPD